MTVTLYVVPGSHPCAAVQRALALKGVRYERVDLLPVAHVIAQRLRFGARTVPGAIVDGEKVLGSRAIMRRLEALVPSPSLWPGDERLADVLRAEEWGDQVLQPIARRLVWACLRRAPGALPSYADGADLPVPISLAALGAGVVAAFETRLNAASDGNVRADLKSLPHHLARVDRWIEDGVLGGEQVNAGDLQIGAGVRLLLTLGDVAPLIDGRPAGRLARDQFPHYPGHVPSGTLPAAWLPPR